MQHSWFCFKLSCQWIQAKRVVLHNRGCHIGKATMPSCHSSVRYTDKKMCFLQHYSENLLPSEGFIFVLQSENYSHIDFLRTGQRRRAETGSPRQLTICVVFPQHGNLIAATSHHHFPRRASLPSSPLVTELYSRSRVRPWSYSNKPEIRFLMTLTWRQTFFNLRKNSQRLFRNTKLGKGLSFTPQHTLLHPALCSWKLKCVQTLWLSTGCGPWPTPSGGRREKEEHWGSHSPLNYLPD